MPPRNAICQGGWLRVLLGLGICGGNSISLALPVVRAITEGKSQWTEVGATLPGDAEEADPEEKMSSSSGGEAVGVTKGSGKGW